MNSVVSWDRAKSSLLFAFGILSKWTQVNQVLFKNVMHCILPISFILFIVWCNFNKMWNTNLKNGYWILLYNISFKFKLNLTIWNGTLGVFTWIKLITVQAMWAWCCGGGGARYWTNLSEMNLTSIKRHPYLLPMPAYAEHGECLNVKPEAWPDNTNLLLMC